MENKQAYRELLSLTKLFLLRECSLQEKKTLSPGFFRSFNPSSRSKAVQEPPKKPLKTHSEEHITEKSSRLAKKKESLPTLEPTASRLEQPKEATIPPPLPDIQETKKATFETIEPSSETKNAPFPAVEEDEKQIKKEFKGFTFTLEKLGAAPQADWKEWWRVCEKAVPEFSLIETLAANPQEASILILSFQEKERERLFLENIAKTLHLRLEPTLLLDATWGKIVEDESFFLASTVKLVIITESSLYSQPSLMRLVESNPKENSYLLNRRPLIVIKDISLYFTQPRLKAALWRSICQHLTAL